LRPSDIPCGGECLVAGVDMHSSGSGSREEERIPRLAPDFDPDALDLTPVEGFLLSRIDGHTSWKALRHIGVLAPDDVDRALERFAKQGVIVIEARGPARCARGEAPRAVSAPESDIDARLGIPVEFQRRVLEFERGLEKPYHEILGVDPRADAKEIKRAYFRLSREYHPDRYFRRNVGPFAARFERIFKKVSEAYELLSDPTTRAEIERSLASMSSAASEEGAYRGVPETGPERIGPDPGARPRGYRLPDRMENLERLRNRFRIPRKLLAERRLKAHQLFQAARVSAHEGRPLEAAASMRLAIAFDPWNADFKSGFADIQGQVYTARAAELLRQAGEAKGQAEVLRLLEEALHYRPCDLEALRRAMAVCLEVNELERAREYAEQLCELEPDVAGHHARLAGVLRRQGLREKAARVAERGYAIDPKDPDVKAERLHLRRGMHARKPGGTA
jgi:curved DNA-binding protein CbpA